ncbi:DUF5719 family protein [Propionicicella superfundia]|uniref:DUF5719 family protein n=1 Tax=Propionicicella superfundia TaxID=348582 RepID=UPI000490514B|nr:DUF5719 family protein [Propionicicella superfundia]
MRLRATVYILIPLVVMGLLLGAVAVVPAASPATAVAPSAVGQAALACAASEGTTAATRTAVAPGGEVTVTGVGESKPKVVAGSVAVATADSSLRISAPVDIAFGGTSIASGDSGPLRGVSLTSCRTPATESWVTGVRSSDDVLTDLVLTNLDKDSAAVDLTFYGADGEVAAPGARGIVVDALSQRSISLKPLVSQDGPVTIHVETSEGRVAAVARETVWQGTNAVGTDWVAPGSAGTDVVVPGVAAGSGTRQLVVTNPGDRSVTASVTALTGNGPVALEGAAQVDVPPQSTRTVSLETGLAQEAAAIRVTATSTIAAAVRADTASAGATSDIAVASAGGALPQRAVLPVAAGTSATTSLLLSNASDTDAAATVRFTDASGASLGDETVSLVAGASASVEVPRTTAVAIEVETTRGSLHGAVVVTATLGKVHGIGIAAYAGLADQDAPRLVEDPHVDERAR